MDSNSENFVLDFLKEELRAKITGLLNSNAVSQEIKAIMTDALRQLKESQP